MKIKGHAADYGRSGFEYVLRSRIEPCELEADGGNLADHDLPVDRIDLGH
jgi:hypothetical protein